MFNSIEIKLEFNHDPCVYCILYYIYVLINHHYYVLLPRHKKCICPSKFSESQPIHSLICLPFFFYYIIILFFIHLNEYIFYSIPS